MKKLLLFVLTSIFLFTACSGCSGKNNDVTDKVEKVVTLNSFDSQADLSTITLNGVLGKVELNSDATYVKSGDKSAKVTVISNPYKSAQPYLFQATKINKDDINCTDFYNVEHVTIEVYNVQDEVKRIGLQMVFTDSYSKGITEWFDVKASGWTTVKYTISREFIPEVTNEDGTVTYLVTGLNILFDRPTENEVFYLDNMKIYRTEKGFTPVKMNLGVDEICSFDKLWQVQKLGFECYDGAELVPMASYVKDNTSTGEGSALRLDTIPGPGAGRWPGIVLNEEMLKLVDWGSYGDEDRLCFDAYTPSIGGIDKIYLNLYVNGIRYASLDGASLKRGEWITISYSVKELNGYSPSSSMDFSKVTGIKLFYLEHTGSPRVIYLDNFRMERAG